MKSNTDALPRPTCVTETAKRRGNKTRCLPKNLITCQSTRLSGLFHGYASSGSEHGRRNSKNYR